MNCNTRAALVAVILFAQAGAAQGQPADRPTGFRSPSGNIHCQAFKLDDGASLRCDIRAMSNRPPPRPKNCDLEYGQAFEVTDKRVVAQRICHGDSVMDSSLPPLGYGATWQRYGFTCKSEPAGVTCSHATGHGFELSRGKQRVF
jgi:hypothetical protein